MEGVGKYCRERCWKRPDRWGRWPQSHEPPGGTAGRDLGLERCLARFRSEGRWGGWRDGAYIPLIVASSVDIKLR